ncbi:MAG: hypothetical protein QNI88_12960, partial [Desulfobacterales bacterium]|nr:hypothetical protein [Desulfobacterales bacterium]
CNLDLMRPVVKRLGKRAVLEIIEAGDHSFRVPRNAGRPQETVYADILERSHRWIEDLLTNA